MAGQARTEPNGLSNAIPLVPWIAVAIALVITIRLNEGLNLGSLSFIQQPPVSELTDLPTVARILLASVAWAISALGFSLVALAAMFTSIFVGVVCFNDLDARKRIVSAAMIVLAAAALVGWIEHSGAEFLSEPKVTDDLRGMTLRKYEQAAVTMDTLFDQVSKGIFVLLVAAASATLTWRGNVPHTALVLKRRLEGLQWVLYVGATALVLRALENYAFYRWPSAWLTAETAQAVDRTALAVSAGYGAFYTAVLISLYVPTALILRLRATSLAKQAITGTGEDQGKWLAGMGLAASPFKDLGHLFLTLAPLLAGGPVAKLIDTLFT